MSQSDCTAVYVHFVGIDAEHFVHGERNNGECLVDFEQVDVVQRKAGLLQHFRDHIGGSCGEPLGFLRG